MQGSALVFFFTDGEIMINNTLFEKNEGNFVIIANFVIDITIKNSTFTENFMNT